MSHNLSPSVQGLSKYWSSHFHLRHSRATSGAHSQPQQRRRNTVVLHCADVECTFKSPYTACVKSKKRLNSSGIGYIRSPHMCMAPDWCVLCYSVSARVISAKAQCCQVLSYRGKERAWQAAPTHPLPGTAVWCQCPSGGYWGPLGL